ncbi:MAG: DUF1918 domain-containing protein [Actinomycetota bacterium]
MPAKKTTAKKAAAKKTGARGSTPRATPPKTKPARRGDVIVIDSAQVGSPPREGEILEVIQGEVSVRYRIRWADGHETLITPSSGTARIVRSSGR